MPLTEDRESLYLQFAEVVSERIILEFELDGISRIDDTGHLQYEYIQFLRHNCHFISEMCEVNSERFSHKQINEAFELVDEYADTYEGTKRLRKLFFEWAELQRKMNESI